MPTNQERSEDDLLRQAVNDFREGRFVVDDPADPNRQDDAGNEMEENGVRTCPVCQDHFFEYDGMFYWGTCSKECARLMYQSHNMTLSIPNLLAQPAPVEQGCSCGARAEGGYEAKTRGTHHSRNCAMYEPAPPSAPIWTDEKWACFLCHEVNQGGGICRHCNRPGRALSAPAGEWHFLETTDELGDIYCQCTGGEHEPEYLGRAQIIIPSLQYAIAALQAQLEQATQRIQAEADKRDVELKRAVEAERERDRIAAYTDDRGQTVQNWHDNAEYHRARAETAETKAAELEAWVSGRFILPTNRCTECGLVGTHGVGCSVASALTPPASEEGQAT